MGDGSGLLNKTLAGLERYCCTFSLAIHSSELRKTSPTHLLAWDCESKWHWVNSSAFSCDIASSGTWWLTWLQFSCYSWWLPPPRWLGAAWRCWQVLVIVLGHTRWSLWGVHGPIPRQSAKSHSSGLLVSLSYLTCGRFLWCSSVELGVVPISHQITKCWSTQRGLACRQAREPRDKNRCLPCVDIVIDWFHSWWLAHSLDFIGDPEGSVKLTLSLVFTFLVYLCRVSFASVASWVV